MLLIAAPARIFADGWTPTDGGLVVNLNQGDRFLLSVWVDLDEDGKEDQGEEFFVCNYSRYTGGHFNYTVTDTTDVYMKLIPQAANATKPSDMSIWTVGAPLNRVDVNNVVGQGKNKDYSLGGIAYTIWNDGRTLRMNKETNFQFFGDLTKDFNYRHNCDVVFVVPTNHETTTSFDPNKTLTDNYKRDDQDGKGRFNGKTGTGFLGMTYREVYMLDIPRFNQPVSYTNAALVTFNTTNKTQNWSWNGKNYQITCKPGHAAYAYADGKHNPTHRTIFRLYMLDDPIYSCGSYFFATDIQNKNLKYRKSKEVPGDSTAAKNVYTWDRLYCMERDGETSVYRSNWLQISSDDSTFFYIGKNNTYVNKTEEDTKKQLNPAAPTTAVSQFRNIRTLKIDALKDKTWGDAKPFIAPVNAYGRTVVDTTSSAENLGVTFEPAGYMLKVNTGKNVPMTKTGDNEWTTQDMWTIDESWVGHTIKATLMTGPEFSETDPGADIEGWSIEIEGSAVPVYDHLGWTPAGRTGYARITTNSAANNGNMVFILNNDSRHLKYNNNDFLGVEIPDQYPTGSDTIVTVLANRLKAGYTFLGWTKNATPLEGEKHYKAGDTIRLSAGETVLYAQAYYDGTLQIALSFMQGGKRYYLTHPNNSAPRYARARHFEDWDNVWQGMENAENLNPNYISTFELRHPINEMKDKIGDIPDLQPNEKVLDPRNYTMKGYVDSLIFYEFFHPANDEYLGLYYTTPNTILANNTWAGLFTTTSEATTTGWPDYKTPYIPHAKLKSTRYVYAADLENEPDSLTLKERDNKGEPFVKYDPATNQFNGVASEGDATDFELSAISVADEHYIILPDTSEVWRDTIDFAYHEKQTKESVWSKLIGKQLLAVMMVGRDAGADTVYFHPNRNKIINDPNELYLSPDFRITQTFTFIPDSRVATDIADEYRPSSEATSNYWHYNILSGESSPLDVRDVGGNYIDIIDTFRIELSQGSISKVKEYRGRWKKGAPGLHVRADGSRYHDVIVRTKTFHYGAEQTQYVLQAAQEQYTFNPLANNSHQLNFNLLKVRSRQMLDIHDNPLAYDTLSVDTLTTRLKINGSYCSLAKGSSYFYIDETTNQHVTLRTRGNNDILGDNLDTLIITYVNLDGEGDNTYEVNARIPLIQTSLEAEDMIWSVKDSLGTRWFIYASAADNDLHFRKYNLRNSILYKEGTTTHLIKGSKNANNDDNQYITTWKFDYDKTDANRLWLKMEDGVNKYFSVADETTPGTNSSETSKSYVTYRYVNVFVSDNANEEELVRLKYGADKWLKLKLTGGGDPYITLQSDSLTASVFSWGYLKQEYSLLNNGAYPSQQDAMFSYNNTHTVDIQTRYKAYREYSMLLDNQITYLCREEQTNLTTLTDKDGDWRTNYSIDLIADSRTATSSGLSKSTNDATLTTTIIPSALSPTNVKIDGKYADIVDTMKVTLSLKTGAPQYRFKGDWSSYKSIDDATLKLPLTRKTYHMAEFDSLVCSVAKEQQNITFPATVEKDVNDTIKFRLSTVRRKGTQVLNSDSQVADILSVTTTDVTNDKAGIIGMHLNNPALAEVRLADEYGNTPTWCNIKSKGDNTVTVQCTSNGIRSPRYAYLYFAYIITVNDTMRFVNYRLTVSQSSFFSHGALQTLVHSKGASGDSLTANGMQQVHENKRILYYFPDDEVELPIRERGFYGWWRWYREGKDENDSVVSDFDIPDSIWISAPKNTGKYNFPFTPIIVDSILKDPEHPELGKKRGRSMGRYTVFHYRAKDYGNSVRYDPPAKTPIITPPIDKKTLTYAVDISNYYDNLPMSVSDKNQVDTALLDTMPEIIEPTLSLREVFELHPWTEMADRMENYKSANAATYTLADEKYMEDHVVMAPLGNRLLLSTEQRYNYENLQAKGHSDSQLGYYMRDDNWKTGGWSDERKDTMIWLGGWDADCVWFTYNTSTHKYDSCLHSITENDDFLNVPVRTTLPAGKEADTVYYCLRARSRNTTTAGTEGDPDPANPQVGDNWFNICRYMIIYHKTDKYGPLVEKTVKGETKALMTNDEIEQHYEVLERLNFDYNKPGSAYTIYPHPLPWADASYGYTYPERPNLPHNRFHDQTDFPNMGEYGIINRIPYSTYWYMMEQHGGAENGYMIYCDGMASAGQVAALNLTTSLCEGQQMYFSGYVGNPSSQSGKACPNFLFSVQGSEDGNTWTDITSYMTGDIQPSKQWYQIYFPIDTKHLSEDTKHFRVRIYNMASNNDGNDFIIDDMCIFATKPQLIAYQANTSCMEQGQNDSLTNVIIRVDYQGFNNPEFNNADMYYTVQQTKEGSTDTTYVKMEDHYLSESTSSNPALPSIYGAIHTPGATYEPTDEDSIYTNIDELLTRADTTKYAYKQGYIYEEVENAVRPVMYVVHEAKMTPDNSYKVRMALKASEIKSSICAMTSNLKVSNRMILELNGEEQETMVVGGCANTTYDISLRVKGSLYLDSVAPMELNGSCVNDWLLYGDTAELTSETRYGYKYSDIVKVVKEILRCEPMSTTNTNQFASSLSAVSRNEMIRIQGAQHVELSDPKLDAYTILKDLVNNGFLTLYKSKITATVASGDSVQYIILPIIGTGSDAIHEANVEVCPSPLFIKLKPNKGGSVPMTIGGLKPEATEGARPVVVLADEEDANQQIAIRIDSIQQPGGGGTVVGVALHSIVLQSTDDDEFVEGLHSLTMVPDREYCFGEGCDNSGYYKNGDTLLLSPAGASTYHMRPGYNYTFSIRMQTRSGSTTIDPLDPTSCEVGTVPFTLSVVPGYLRWDPQNAQNARWNDPDNWIGINQQNKPINDNARFAPLSTTNVVIPAMTEGMPYPMLPASIAAEDSVQKVGFKYNTCGVIRFLPGTAVDQPQRLNCTEVVIDMSLPKNQWALRSAPVKGMLSGDIFMSDADLNYRTSPWEVGTFDASGRNATTGNASYWLSMYSQASIHQGNTGTASDTAAVAADWARATNAMTQPLQPAQGWAVYTKTKSGKDAAVRLPKNDDIYYYFTVSGDKSDYYESNIRNKRQTAAGAGTPGDLAFHPAGSSESYTLTNGAASKIFVFGNPTMGYIDIWGFISDNSLKQEISYLVPYDATSSEYITVTWETARGTTDTITNQKRYLPPMHAIVVSLPDEAAATTTKTIVLNTNRVVTSAAQKIPSLAAPARRAAGLSKGIMTVTAINPASNLFTSRLQLGQGYHKSVREGEDAVLKTINIDHYDSSTPMTPFNIYAAEGSNGLSIDLRDSILNVPVSFYMSDVFMEYYAPTTQLWFTGVNNIDGQLVLYDEWTGSERRIVDGGCLNIETPEQNHETRYYIRRRGYQPNSGSNPIATDVEQFETDGESAVKIIRDGQVLVIRNGHVFTMFGQKVR